MFSGDFSCPERMRVARTCVKPVSLPFSTFFCTFVKVPTTADRVVSFLHLYGLCAVSLAGSGELSDEAAREDQFPRIRYLVEKVMTCVIY
jgi:hypothetical protein